MCYSSSLTSKNIDLSKKYKKEIPPELAEEPLFHVSAFAFPEWRIITTAPEIQTMNWGLVPAWFSGNNTAEIASKTINARSETLLEKASFKHLIGRQHCVIPSTGFFEYQHVGKEKIPYFVHPAKEALFSMAGIFDIYKNPLSGAVQKTFSIITCEANELMADIHNTKKRMPVMLAQDQIENWLMAKPAEIHSFFTPCPNNWLDARKVNPKIINGEKHNSIEAQMEFMDPRGVQGNLF